MIICPRCNHDNPLGRIFCMKCGERLDLSRVKSPAEMEREKKEGKVSTGSVLQQKAPINYVLLAKRAARICVLIILAVIGYLLWQQPSLKVIPITQAFKEIGEEKISDLKDAVKSEDKIVREFNEAELASYIEGRLKYTPSEGFFDWALSKVLVELNQNEVSVVSFWSVGGKNHHHDFIMKHTGKVRVERGSLGFEPRSCSIGKLPIPQFLFGLFSKKLATLADRFKEEFSAAAKQGQVTIEPGKVTVRPAAV